MEQVSPVPREQERDSREESICDLHEDHHTNLLEEKSTQQEEAEGFVPLDSEPLENEEDEDSEQPGPSWAQLQVGSEDSGSRIFSLEPESEDETSLEEEPVDLSWSAPAPLPHTPQAGAKGYRDLTFTQQPDPENETSSEEEPLDLSWSAPLPHTLQAWSDGFGFTQQPDPEDEMSLDEEPVDLSSSASAPLPHTAQAWSEGFGYSTFTQQPDPENETSLEEEPVDFSWSAPLPHTPQQLYPQLHSPPLFMEIPTPTIGGHLLGPVMVGRPPSTPGSPSPPGLHGDRQLRLLFEVQRQQILLQKKSQRALNLQVQQQRRHHMALQRRQQRLECYLLTINRKLEGIDRALRPPVNRAPQMDPMEEPQRVEQIRAPRPARGRRGRPPKKGARGSS
ncbi:uncharacterized protein ACMZJ9_022479 isoform 2-T2 [Mantella aurantiaca]